MHVNYLKYLIIILVGYLLSGCNQSSDIPLKVAIVGDNYLWKVCYAGQDGILLSQDDIILNGDLYLPDNHKVEVYLSSKDNFYFWIAEDFQLKGLAQKNQVEKLTFETSAKGVFKVEADPMCGFSHESLEMKIVVVDEEQFQKFIAENQALPYQ